MPRNFAYFVVFIWQACADTVFAEGAAAHAISPFATGAGV
jgi:hypothetical protein